MANKLRRRTHSGKIIRKKHRAIIKMRGDLNKYERKLQCDCLHTDDRGKPDVRIESRDQEKNQQQNGHQNGQQHGQNNNKQGNNNPNGGQKKNNEPESVVFECKNCSRKMLVNRIDQSMLTSSIKTCANAVDIIKLKLNPEKNDDLKVADWISPFQFHLLYHLETLYKAVMQQEKKKRPAPLSPAYGQEEIRRRR